MFRIIILGTVMLLASHQAFAVEVKQGVLYEQGTLIESSQLGVAFTIPQGWQGAWPNGSQFFILESTALQASLIMMFDTIDQQQLVQLMSQTIPLDSGVFLQPLSRPETNKQIVQAHYAIMGAGQNDKAFVVGKEVRPGLSVAIIALSQSDSEKVHQISSKIVSTLESRSVEAPATTSNDQGRQSWQAYMRGRYIARYYTGSGYREKEELWLCSDGTFHSSFNSGGFSMNGASGASQSGGRGRWHAEGDTSGTGTLVLQFGAGKVVTGQTPGTEWTEKSAGGERWTYQLDLNNNLYLNNQQWLRGSNEYCQ